MVHAKDSAGVGNTCCSFGDSNLLQVIGGIKSGLTLQQQMDSFLEAAHACREGGVNGRLRQVLKAQLQRCACWCLWWHML
jgi:hypothetical protein